MLKLFKISAGAFVLAALALPVGAQQVPGASEKFPTAEEIMRPAPKQNANTPRYAIAFGKVLARIDKSGITKFNYQGGRIVSEVLPNSVIGTYQYDRTGRFQGVFYNDGKIIKVTYKADGSISGLITNTKARVTFKGQYKTARNALPLRGFLAIQNAVSGILNNTCISDVEGGCVVFVPGHREEEPSDVPEGPYYDPDPFSGGPSGGNAGGTLTIYPRTGTTYETVEQCQKYVCERAKDQFDTICRTVARPGADRVNCFQKSQEYYSTCNPSCERADWSWLNSFSFNWG
jgi:hypothetical protein